jgi:hypothetical protein
MRREFAGRVLLGAVGLVLLAVFSALPCSAGTTPSDEDDYANAICYEAPWFCTDPEVNESTTAAYIGHDEPALLFYSDVPGSGNSSFYTLTLPTDPPSLPKQEASGGTFNFQLVATYWFGLALCDDQSSPNPGTVSCTPDSDANIFDNPNPNAPDYVGKHPGTSYMELQFYPPDWKSIIGCDGTHWCAALTITEASSNPNTGQVNKSCKSVLGDEDGSDQALNFAYLTRSGVSDSPASPANPTRFTFNSTNDAIFNSGDTLTVQINDTPDGVRALVADLTTGESGSMTASALNGYSQLLFDPVGTQCNTQPYAFRPMYATSTERTFVSWSAHSYNVAASGEIGHFEYCSALNSDGSCKTAGPPDPSVDADDVNCFTTNSAKGFTLTGCIGDDLDFDGPPYQLTWPGTNPDASTDAQLHPEPILFTSPTFQPSGSAGQQTYERIAFETNLSQIEGKNQPCDLKTGNNCTNPPTNALFYPFYTTRPVNGQCEWQLGGAFFPGTTNTFGGTPTAEYGQLALKVFPGNNMGVPQANPLFTDYRQKLNFNPCQVTGGQHAGTVTAPGPITISSGAGQNIQAGSFRYKNTGGATQHIGTVAVAVSNPAILSSLTVTASGQSANVTPVNTSNALSFSTPIAIDPGATVSFKITAQLATTSSAAKDGLIYAALKDLGSSNHGGKGPWGAGLVLIGLVLAPFGNRRRKALITLGLLTLMAGFAACGGSSGNSSPSGTSAAATTNGDLSRSITLSTVSMKGSSTSTVQQLIGLGFQ